MTSGAGDRYPPTVAGMRTLVFGGTRFLSRAVAADALVRGHDVVCAARGESGTVPEGARFTRIDRDAGGRVLVPADAGDVPSSWIDVRDLAAWIVDAVECGLTGKFDATGPAVPVQEVLATVAATVAPPGTELVPVPADFLRAAGVIPWSGPRSLPLWLPPEKYGLVDHDVSASSAAGLRARPLAETAVDALAHERALGVDRPRRAGLTAAEEAELLSAWQAGMRR